ncbi:MAG: hypothetical protein ABSH38_06160 [Verrucomicrobiota bacterium]|jgi:hypothetical protein
MARRNNSLSGTVLFLALLWLAPDARAAPQAAVPPGRIAAEQAYDAAKDRYQTNSADDEAAWQFARACFNRAEWAGKDSERAAVAKEGIAVCEKLLPRSPNLAAAYYYLGLNQAELARTKKLGGLSLVKEMEKAWKTARDLDAHFDFAGPDRSLGLLYRDAPHPPLSIGHRASAEEHAQRAVELAPEYPDNHLDLIETHLKWDQLAAAAREDDALCQLLPAAQKQFSGPQWQIAWQEWDRRQEAIEKKLHHWRNTAARRRAP